jgi:hypothetical protein
MMELFDEEL